MAGVCGNTATIAKNSVELALLHSPEITINHEDVDIGTSKWRELLGGCGLASIDVSSPFIASADAETRDMITDMTYGAIDQYDITIPGIGVFSGDFKVTGSISAQRNNAVTGTINMKSSGAVAFTPSA